MLFVYFVIIVLPGPTMMPIIVVWQNDRTNHKHKEDSKSKQFFRHIGHMTPSNRQWTYATNMLRFRPVQGKASRWKGLSLHRGYWPVLVTWADFLVASLPDPGKQLCTDDFEDWENMRQQLQLQHFAYRSKKRYIIHTVVVQVPPASGLSCLRCRGQTRTISIWLLWSAWRHEKNGWGIPTTRSMRTWASILDPGCTDRDGSEYLRKQRRAVQS